MDNYRAEIWRQWDRQVNTDVEIHRRLSNLYLSVERGDTPLTISVARDLRTMAGTLYPQGDGIMNDTFREYWLEEFMKLEGWLDV